MVKIGPRVGLVGHEEHTHQVHRENENTADERAWFICVSCQVFLDEMVLCGAPTKRGPRCRVAMPVSLDTQHCWRHP